MNLRSFAPGLAPQAKAGTRFEPGHRQLVRLFDGQWHPGAYDRVKGRFWLRSVGGWIALQPDAVRFWTQMPPWAMPDPEIPLDMRDFA